MTGLESFFRPRLWLAGLLLAVLVSGCGGSAGEDGGSAQLTAAGIGTGVGGAGQGPAPVNLRTASNFVILTKTEITNIPTSAVTGNVGLTSASGTSIHLTCPQVTGVIYTVDAAGPPCRVRDAARLTRALNDALAAWSDGVGRTPDYTGLGGGNIGGRNLGPAVYKWRGSVHIPTNLKLTGGPNDVWIFLIEQDLIVGSGVQIILDGALPQNVYWLTVIDTVDLGNNSQFKGVILAETEIVMRTGASIDGRLLATNSVNLDQNTVTQPGP